MGTTYTAWDGNEYEWPPPKGWYQAIDNRWWAPDTGPMAMGETGPAADATMQMEQGSEIINPAAVRQDTSAPESELPAWARPKQTTTNVIGESTPNQSDNSSMLLGLLIGCFVLFVLGALFFLIRGGDEDPIATPGDTASQTSETTEQEPSESTENTQTPEPTTSEVEIVLNDQSISRFNAYLESSTTSPSDLDTEAHAETVCNASGAEQTPEAYVDVRAGFVAGTQKFYVEDEVPEDERLSAKEITELVDATVEAFCPSLLAPLEIDPIIDDAIEG